MSLVEHDSTLEDYGWIVEERKFGLGPGELQAGVEQAQSLQVLGSKNHHRLCQGGCTDRGEPGRLGIRHRSWEHTCHRGWVIDCIGPEYCPGCGIE